MEQWPDAFRFIAKNHHRSSSVSNCSLLDSRFTRSRSTRPSQGSKYTGGSKFKIQSFIAPRHGICMV